VSFQALIVRYDYDGNWTALCRTGALFKVPPAELGQTASGTADRSFDTLPDQLVNAELKPRKMSIRNQTFRGTNSLTRLDLFFIIIVALLTSLVTVSVGRHPALSPQRAPAVASRPSNEPVLARNMTYPTADYIYPSDIGYYNVKNYGAKGDGLKDDTLAIQHAIAAAVTCGNAEHGCGGGLNASGDTVYFPAGTYLVHDMLTPWLLNKADPAVVKATLSGGCVNGFSIVHPGSGYPRSFDAYNGSNNAALWVTGGGGSGFDVESAVLSEAGGVANINTYGRSCIGQGYTSPPQIQVMQWVTSVRFEGQNKSNTVIRLADNTPGYNDANCSVSIYERQPRPPCKPLLKVNSANANASGADEGAYQNDILNFTINVGRNNPGAVGISYVGSNRAELKNVIIKSEDGKGRCGLEIAKTDVVGASGPALIKNVQIIGFDIGIDLNVPIHEVGHTFEYIDLEHQNQFGVINAGYSNWFREVSSLNSVPVFVNCSTRSNGNEYCANDEGSLLVVDSTFVGESSRKSAILLQNAGSSGVAFLRNIVTSGYASALAIGPKNAVVPGSRVTEYSSPAPEAQFSGTPLVSLNLQNIPNTPEFVDNDFSEWADVSKFGMAGDGCHLRDASHDATACIQAAMNSGKPVVFFPYGGYSISSTIQVPSSVRRIIGSEAALVGNGGVCCVDPFSFNSNGAAGTEVDYLYLEVGSLRKLIYNGSSPLILKAVFAPGGTLTNTSNGTGDIYLEDYSVPCFNMTLHPGQHLYARQWNAECNNRQISGGIGWFFGIKTEQADVPVLTGKDTTVEVLGSFGSTACTAGCGASAFDFTDSQFSLADIAQYSDWGHAVSETRRGVRRYRGKGGWEGVGIGLYAGHK
jgi:Pectate lyase superfamily protein